MILIRLIAFIASFFGYNFEPVFLDVAPEAMVVEREFQWDGGDVRRGTEPPMVALTPAPDRRPTRGPAIASPAPIDGRYATVDLTFATNRAEVPDAPLPARFGGELADLVYGTATVSIPRDHQPGVLESQNWLMSFITSPNPEKHVLVQSLTVMDTQQVLAEMNRQAGDGNRAILAYIHGYNTSFDKAARRMGQMAFDLQWGGAAFFYSWPSQGQAKDYLVDDTAAERSVRVMKQVLTDLGITTVILAAPDIDKEVFIHDIAPRLTQMNNASVTLYASSEDTALKASQAARGFPRIGDNSGGLVLVDGIEIVDATGAESDFFGHTYFGDNARIIDDMSGLINDGLPADQRPLLAPVPFQDGTFWRMRDAE